jgi:predicted permease
MLSMALLVSAGLFMKSLYNINTVDLGMNIDNVVTFRIAPVLNGYTAERSRVLFERLEDELSALPNVTGVAASMVELLAGNNFRNNVSVEGFQAGQDTDRSSSRNDIGPGYFRTLGVPLLLGREFTRNDDPRSTKVAVVNEAFARKFNLGRNPIGKRMKIGADNGNLDIEIVGLVRDTKYGGVKDKHIPLFYLPYRQNTGLARLSFYIRTSSAREPLLASVRPVVSRMDPELPVADLRTMEFQIWDNTTGDRVIGVFSTAFAVLATVLAAVGLYGVLAYSVAQRTREIGLRMALGAEPRRVRRMVLRQVSWMTLVGAGSGLAAGAGIGRLAESLLFDMKGYDPIVLGSAAFLLVIVALGSGYIPAHRASRIDPMRALRYE